MRTFFISVFVYLSLIAIGFLFASGFQYRAYQAKVQASRVKAPAIKTQLKTVQTMKVTSKSSGGGSKRGFMISIR